MIITEFKDNPYYKEYLKISNQLCALIKLHSVKFEISNRERETDESVDIDIFGNHKNDHCMISVIFDKENPERSGYCWVRRKFFKKIYSTSAYLARFSTQEILAVLNYDTDVLKEIKFQE